MELKETGKVELQCIRGDYKELINNRLPRKLDPYISSKLQPQTTEPNLGVESTEVKFAIALRAIANSKAVRTDWLPAELQKLGLSQNRSILRELHRLIMFI